MENNNENIISQEISQLGMLTTRERKAMWLASFVNSLMMYGFLNAIVWVILAINLGYLDKRYNGMGQYILIAVQFFITYKLHDYGINKRIKKFDSALSHYMHETISSLKKVDYFCRCPFSGLAVDVEDKKVAIIEGDLIQPKDTKAMVYPLDKIKEITFLKPDVSVELQSTNINNGGAMGLAQNAIMSMVDEEVNKGKISRAKIEAEKKTGLYFEFDDIHKQSAFLMMQAEQAERWLVVFEKLFDGSLEPQTRPLEFPRPEDVPHIAR